MSDEQNKERSELRDEFKTLGDNFKAVFASAWESDERKHLQRELEAGMQELGQALNDLASGLRSGQAGETLRKEVDDLSERVRSGEVESKAREEILKALRALNAELEKAADRFDPDIER